MSTDQQRCEQCGREGVRGFKLLGGYWDDSMFPQDNNPVWVPFITVCANTNACRKRRPSSEAPDA